MTAAPALYTGTVRHRRHAPTGHQFRYSVFMVLLDIDRIPEAMAISPLAGYNRRCWAAFDDRDHIGDPSRPLRERLIESAARAGIALPEGPILLLTHLRYAGYVFNPISLYYCYGGDGRVRQVLADVRNTCGGRHAYWLTPEVAHERRLTARAAKAMYVSPFMAADVDYQFLLTPPGESLVAHINVLNEAGGHACDAGLFDATLTLRRLPWTAASFHGALLRQPMMTAKVIAAIHWEAMRLRLKGVPLVPVPSRP